MAKLSFFPKDKKFYVLFNDLSNCLVEVTQSFEEFLQTYAAPGKKAQTAELTAQSASLQRLMDYDRQGDDKSDELMKALFSTFVTPMDREDIHGLTKTVTSIIEHVTSAARRFDMYHINEVERPALELAGVLIECAKEVDLLIRHLDNLSNLEHFTPHIENLNQLEKKGDRIYRAAIKELFDDPTDTLHVLKWKDVFERLENAIDKCKTAASILMGIILKYA